MKLLYFFLIILIILKFQYNDDIETTVDWFYNFTNNEYLIYEYDIKSKLLFESNIKPSLRKLASTWVLSEYYLYSLKQLLGHFHYLCIIFHLIHYNRNNYKSIYY